MKPSAAPPRTTLPIRCLVAFLLSGLAAGCGGGPRLSLSPSKWPGSVQVAGAGKKFGGLVPRRSKSNHPTTAATENGVAQSQWSRQQPAAAAKRRPVYDKGLWGGTQEPVDPFLARAHTGNLHSDETPPGHDANRHSTGSNTPAAKHSDVLPVGHERSSSEQSTPDDGPQPSADEIPFTDVAGSLPRRPESAGERTNDGNRFAAGFDSQLAELRGEADEEPPLEAAAEWPLESNPLRDAILGLPDRASERGVIATVAGVDEPASDEEEEPVGRAVVSSMEPGQDELPEWARPQPAAPQEQAPLPVEEPAAAEQPPAMAANEELPQPRMAINESTLPPVDVDDLLPSAIEIVPAPTGFPTESLSPGSVTSASERVELLPAPVQSSEESFDLVKDDFSGMIVTTDNLPSGFAEWDELPSSARETVESGSSDHGAAYLREAMNSPQPTPALTLPADESLEGIFLVDERAEVSVPQDTEETAQTTSEPHFFAPTGGEAGAAESELDSVSWDPETEPGAASIASPYQSTLVVTILIGLACAIGIAVIRRMHTAF